MRTTRYDAAQVSAAAIKISCSTLREAGCSISYGRYGAIAHHVLRLSYVHIQYCNYLYLTGSNNDLYNGFELKKIRRVRGRHIKRRLSQATAAGVDARETRVSTAERGRAIFPESCEVTVPKRAGEFKTVRRQALAGEPTRARKNPFQSEAGPPHADRGRFVRIEGTDVGQKHCVSACGGCAREEVFRAFGRREIQVGHDAHP